MRKNIPSCLKDTKGFISKANRSGNTIKIFLITLDIKSMHANIPNYKGIEKVIEKLNKARKKYQLRSANLPPPSNFSKDQKLFLLIRKVYPFF